MNSKINLILVCFVISLINVFNVFDVSDAVRLVRNDSGEIGEFSLKDMYNLHHAFVFEDMKWDGGQINFKIDKNFDAYEIDKILGAMYEIERSSCIRFVAHNPSNGFHYVMITKDYGSSFSSADVGCIQRGEQSLRLSSDMVDEHQTILHELLHTIGFRHQHQRSDRDNYVELHLENTNLSESAIFVDFTPIINVDPRITYITPFDFNSVMLYDEYSFSINDEPVITSKIKGINVPSVQDRNRGLSNYDVILLNEFYDCGTVDERKSKLFYEDWIGMPYPPIVNYHEVQRAKKYLPRQPQHVEGKNQLDEQLEDVNNRIKANNEDHKDENGADDEVEARNNNEEEYDDKNDGQLLDVQYTNLTNSEAVAGISEAVNVKDTEPNNDDHKDENGAEDEVEALLHGDEEEMESRWNYTNRMDKLDEENRMESVDLGLGSHLQNGY